MSGSRHRTCEDLACPHQEDVTWSVPYDLIQHQSGDSSQNLLLTTTNNVALQPPTSPNNTSFLFRTPDLRVQDPKPPSPPPPLPCTLHNIHQFSDRTTSAQHVLYSVRLQFADAISVNSTWLSLLRNELRRRGRKLVFQYARASAPKRGENSECFFRRLNLKGKRGLGSVFERSWKWVGKWADGRNWTNLRISSLF